MALTVLVLSSMGMAESLIEALAGLFAVTGLVVPPWIVLASWARGNLSGSLRWLQTVGPGLLLAIAYVGFVLIVRPISEGFARYETGKIWLTATSEVQRSPNGVLSLELEGQLDLSDPYEPCEPCEPCEPQLCPTELGGGQPPCLAAGFDRSWVPSGETFALTVTVEAEGLQDGLGGWKLCCRKLSLEEGTSGGCFSGFEWPAQKAEALWPLTSPEPAPPTDPPPPAAPADAGSTAH